MSSRNDFLTETYQPLTNINKKETKKQKWTACLLFCCLAACTASFQFGYNIGSLNLPAEIIKDFFGKNAYSNQYGSDFKFKPDITNVTIAEIKDYKNKHFIITNTGFVIGGMLGAFTSKYVADFFGRKSGILFHNLFTIIGAILVLVARYFNSTYCVVLSRTAFGIQGGMMCGLIPTYLNEISPESLRGATGVLSQLFITVGILVSQTLGFRQFLGTEDYWHILLALPIVPSLIGGFALLLFFPESPKALLLDEGNREGCRKALEKLRNTKDVGDEIAKIESEANDSNTSQSLSIVDLFKSTELRWPLLTGLILNITQQLCGINAVFFYSESIFKKAGIEDEYIQYAVFATGLINVISTIIVVPLVDKLGRKPLLTFPMIVIIIDFFVLTILLKFKDVSSLCSYLSIFCIILFIMCFAVGLGPIPFIYVAEVFRQEARSAAIAVCMFSNWVANLLLASTFPYMVEFLNQYVFLVFALIVIGALLMIFSKVPETKGKTVDEIMQHFNGENYYKREIQMNQRV